MPGEWFFKRLENGEKLLRHWLVYSHSLDSIHFFCCRLFGSDISLFGRREGFKNWRKLNLRVSRHEQSHSHEEASMKWKEMCMRLERGATMITISNGRLKSPKPGATYSNAFSMVFSISPSKTSLFADTYRQSFIRSSQKPYIYPKTRKYDPVLSKHLTRIQ